MFIWSRRGRVQRGRLKDRGASAARLMEFCSSFCAYVVHSCRAGRDLELHGRHSRRTSHKPNQDRTMRNILFLVSEWGYWGEELIGPLEACEKAGYKIEFCTPTGD